MRVEMLRKGLWALAFVMVMSSEELAVATDAEDLIGQGINLRKEGRDQEALPLFAQAVKQQPTPRAFAQLGTCEQALGLWAGAETHIEEALKHPGDSWIQKNEAALRTALAYVQQRLGSIDVWGSPAGARVSVDGNFVGTIPMSRRARAAVGRRAVAVEAPGFLAESRTVEVQAGALIREHVALRSIAAPEPATRAAPVVGASTPAAALPTPPVETHEGATPAVADGSETGIHKKWWFWAIVGTVAVAAGGTVYFLATRNDGCQASMGGTCTTF